MSEFSAKIINWLSISIKIYKLQSWLFFRFKKILLFKQCGIATINYEHNALFLPSGKNISSFLLGCICPDSDDCCTSRCHCKYFPQNWLFKQGSTFVKESAYTCWPGCLHIASFYIDIRIIFPSLAMRGLYKRNFSEKVYIGQQEASCVKQSDSTMFCNSDFRHFVIYI